MGRLTTHVLDTAQGRPAGGLRLRLLRHDGGAFVALLDAVTDDDGRCPRPLLDGAALRAGRYRLVFWTAAYFRAAGVPLSDPPFLDEVTLDFGVADVDAHYHVPLLLSPWSYSTYRGS
jgi:5-hydroxyisourate hydrolase